MTTITQAPICTVIVTVDTESDVMSELEDHARAGLAAIAELDGFISGALHRSTDGSRLIQYLQWRGEVSHRACMNDPR